MLIINDAVILMISGGCNTVVQFPRLDIMPLAVFMLVVASAFVAFPMHPIISPNSFKRYLPPELCLWSTLPLFIKTRLTSYPTGMHHIPETMLSITWSNFLECTYLSFMVSVLRGHHGLHLNMVKVRLNTMGYTLVESCNHHIL